MANIDDLPDDVLEFIIAHLRPYKDFESLKIVSSRWNNLIKSKFLTKIEAIT